MLAGEDEKVSQHFWDSRVSEEHLYAISVLNTVFWQIGPYCFYGVAHPSPRPK